MKLVLFEVAENMRRLFIRGCKQNVIHVYINNECCMNEIYIYIYIYIYINNMYEVYIFVAKHF